MSTESTTLIYKTFRDRLLGYVPPGGGATLGARLGDRVYQDSAPDAVVYPYAVMRIINKTTQQYQVRIAADLEVDLYHRPRTQLAAHREAADLLEQAFLFFRSTASGLLMVRGAMVSPIAMTGSEVDREVLRTHFVFPFFAWPTYRAAAAS